MEKIISKVHSLLIEFEKSIKRNKQPIVGASFTPQVMAIQGGRVQKYKPQGKAKGKGKGKGKGKESAARILNMVSTKKVNKTPYELWHGKVPNLSYLKVWGCYYFHYPPENKIVVERYADFLEKDFILRSESGRIVELEDEDILPSETLANILIRKKVLP
nr:hypothetical protein [Tanacetum cinerariifolium]